MVKRIAVFFNHRPFRRTLLVMAVMAALESGASYAGEKLDMSFIQGGAGTNPDVWAGDAANLLI